MFRYSLLVLSGACSIGILAILVKFAYHKGFSLGEIIGSQYLIGWFILLVITLLFFRQRFQIKQAIILFFAGTSASFTGIFYYGALETIPASTCIILLFQFVWIGILIEAVTTRTFPTKEKIISVVFLLAGTVISSGFLEKPLDSFEMKGITLGLLSAFSFAFYIFVSGKVAVNVPAFLRSLLLITGALVLICIVFPPTFIYDGTFEKGLWKYGIALGTFSIVIPSISFTIGIPKIGSGSATILAAAELPVTMILSALILKESIIISQWAGVALILIGISIPHLFPVIFRIYRGYILKI